MNKMFCVNNHKIKKKKKIFIPQLKVKIALDDQSRATTLEYSMHNTTLNNNNNEQRPKNWFQIETHNKFQQLGSVRQLNQRMRIFNWQATRQSVAALDSNFVSQCLRRNVSRKQHHTVVVKTTHKNLCMLGWIDVGAFF